MFMLNFCIGLLFGIGCTVLLKRLLSARKVVELSSSQVVLVKGLTPPQVKQAKNIAFFGEEPVLFTLKPIEHSFSFQEQQSLLCSDHERIDLICTLSATPKMDEDALNQLFAAAHPQDILDRRWQTDLLGPKVQGATSILRTQSRSYWLQNVTELNERLNRHLQDVLPAWSCVLSTVHLAGTSDLFYNLNDPLEVEATQQRKLLQLQNQNLEAQIVALQKQRSHLEQIETETTAKQSHVERQEQLLQHKTQRLDVLLQQLQTNIQTEIEMLKATIHKDVGSMSMQFRKDLASQGIAIPKQAQQQILQRKNQLLSEMEQQKRSLLYDSKEIDPSDETPSATNPDQR